MMKTIKSTIGLAAVCITAVAMADGDNVVSFEKALVAKDAAGVSAGACVASGDAERLLDARHVAMTSAKLDECVRAANTRLRSGDALAADASMTLLKGMPGGGKPATNKAGKSESLKMPSFNENDFALSKSVDSRSMGDGGNLISSQDRPLLANTVEMSVVKAPDALMK